MPDTKLFQSKDELVDYIAEYLINHDDTISIIRKDFKKEIVKSLLNKEDFEKFNDTSKDNGNVLFLIKTSDNNDRNLKIKICDAYSENTKKFKMVDINNILVIDGLISQEDMNSIIYYKEITKMQLKETA
jgi:hypothetical protein